MNLDVKVKQNVVKWQNIMSSSLCMDFPDLIAETGPFCSVKMRLSYFWLSSEVLNYNLFSNGCKLLLFSTFL